MDLEKVTDTLSAIISLLGLAAAIMKFLFKQLLNILSSVESLETSTKPAE